jgi:integrase
MNSTQGSNAIAPEGKPKKSRKRRGRGEGAIFQRADGMWCAALSLGYDEHGKRNRRVIYGATKKETQQRLRDLQDRADKGTLPDISRLTVKNFLNRWLETVKATKAPHTHLQYEQHCRLHLVPVLGSLRLARLTRFHVRQMYTTLAAKGVSASQQRRVGTTLRVAVGQAMEDGLLHANPCHRVPKPHVEREEMQTWDVKQTAQFLQAAGEDRLYAMYVLAFDTGLRQGELFGLHWPDLDFTSSSLFVKRSLEEVKGVLRTKDCKTKKSRRRVTLSAVAVKALHEHRKRMLVEGHIDGPLFCDTNGSYLRKSNVVRRSFDRIVKQVNEREKATTMGHRESVLLPRIRFQDLRHTSATLLLLANENLKVVSERLGHASVKMTGDTYSHVTPTMQKAAAEKMNRILGQAVTRTAAKG